MFAFSLMCAVLLLCGTSQLSADHFVFTANTGSNATLVVPKVVNPSIGTVVLETGDEIGVFTASGLCAGATEWLGENTVITVWGDDTQTSEVDGCISGDTLYFRFWDSSEQSELSCNTVMYQEGEGIWSNNGFQILSALGVALDETIRLNIFAYAGGMFDSEAQFMREHAFLSTESPYDSTSSQLDSGASTWCQIELIPQSDTTSVAWQASFPLYRSGRLASNTEYIELLTDAPVAGMYAIRLSVAGHLPVRTAHFHAISPLISEVNFTNSANIRTGIYSNLDEVNPGVFALVPGNLNTDNIINASDRAIVRNSRSHVGYSLVDFDGNGIVNATERVVVRNNLYRYSPL